jgi:hypothetical protein
MARPENTNDLDKLLERFASDVAGAAGENLSSLVLYGSAASGSRSARSDVNLLLVLEDASAAALHPLGPVFRDWVRRGQPPPLVFSAAGWRNAADVFPIEIEDIRHQHRVLRGSDPVEDLATTRADLRHALEREARSLIIQLRASYAGATSDGRALSAVVSDSLSTVLVLFRAALRLTDTAPPTDAAELVAAVAEHAGFDRGAFAWPIEQRAATKPKKLQSNDPIAATYLDAIAAFVDYVDRL